MEIMFLTLFEEEEAEEEVWFSSPGIPKLSPTPSSSIPNGSDMDIIFEPELVNGALYQDEYNNEWNPDGSSNEVELAKDGKEWEEEGKEWWLEDEWACASNELEKTGCGIGGGGWGRKEFADWKCWKAKSVLLLLLPLLLLVVLLALLVFELDCVFVGPGLLLGAR